MSEASEVWAAKRLLFSRKEVAKLLAISERQITRVIADGKLDIVRIGSRTMIARDEVEKFAKNGIHFLSKPPSRPPQEIPQ
jgi:excisionase family DNA binding protein